MITCIICIIILSLGIGVESTGTEKNLEYVGQLLWGGSPFCLTVGFPSGLSGSHTILHSWVVYYLLGC